MFRERVLTVWFALMLLCAAIILAIGDPIIIAQESDNQVITSATPQPSGKRAVANVASGFTYQGYLTDEGQPANGAYDIGFFLYDAETGSTLIDDTTVGDIVVTDGRFTQPLTFSDSTFAGTELWLELRVRPGESAGSYTTLTPRQRIQPAPYANSLRPGASITAAFTDTLLTLDNDADRGLYVEAQDDGIQVTAGSPDFFGYALGAGTGIEVNAENNGVYVGRANEHGIWVNNSGNHSILVSHADGDGLRVEDAAEYGIYAVSIYDGGNTSAAGVYGERIGYSGGYGGHFVHEGTTGQAVYGEATNQGGFDSEAVVGAVASTGGESFEAWHAGSGTDNYFVGCQSSDPNNLNCNAVTFQINVDGSIDANSAFVGGGGDYAEMMTVAGDETAYAPGDVLVVGADGQLVKSSEPYQQAVVGVYSTQPAVIGDPRPIHQRMGLGEDESAEVGSAEHSAAEIEQFAASDGLVPVALVGVVPINVSGENGAIAAGDLLATSGVPGHVMKAVPIEIQRTQIYPTGTIVGKAMQAFNGETGIIKMLVMLQ